MSFIATSLGFTSIAVKSINLDATSVNLSVGEFYKLETTFTPANTTNRNVTFSSANNSIATVTKDGNIKGINAGKTVITVTSASNKNVVTNCNVTVQHVAIKLKTMITQPAGMGAFEEMSFFKKMEKITNIKMEFITIPEQASKERKSIAFASNDLPDIFLKMDISTQDELLYGEQQGMLIPLEKLLAKNAPNFSRLMEQDKEVKRVVTSPSGHIYGLPKINKTPRDSTGKIWINNTWLKKLSLPVPQTVEEYYMTLKAFKQKDPNRNGKADEIPLSFVGISHFNYLLGSWGVLRDKNSLFVDDSNNVVFAPTTDGFKQALKFYNKLYAEKLLDSASFTQNNQQQKAKGSGSEELLGSFMSAGPQLVVGDSRADDYVIIPALKGTKEKPMWIKFDEIIRGTFSITKSNKYPEESLRWVDFLYSKQGGIMQRYGVANVDWKMNRDGTWTVITPHGMNKNEAKQRSVPYGGFGGFPGISPVYFVLSEKEETPLGSFINKEVEKLKPYLRIAYPSVYLESKAQKSAAALFADMIPYVDQMFVKFIVGESNIDKEWQDYVNTFKKMNMDEYVKIYQSAYDKYRRTY